MIELFIFNTTTNKQNSILVIIDKSSDKILLSIGKKLKDIVCDMGSKKHHKSVLHTNCDNKICLKHFKSSFVIVQIQYIITKQLIKLINENMVTITKIMHYISYSLIKYMIHCLR